ncbi:MAG: 5'-nucleotidase C-terminal domain-containing protein [Armatimonadota bacterium]|jgi:2',3'-cyclic-nucleotide 2'-phosphodiesterase (5'-nucleotidase family)
MTTSTGRTAAVALAVAVAVMLVAGSAFAGTTAAELTSANAQRAETSFGDLATDALVATTSTTIALVPAVSFKSGTIPSGPVTRANVSELLTQPTETWAVVSLSDAQLRATLERSVSRAPQPNAGFLQVSGISMTYDPNLPRNSRIVNLTVSGADVQTDQNYEVAMPLSLAKGGSGYFTIFGEGDIVRTGSTELADAIVNYVEQRGTVSYTGQGRITPANGG